MQTLITLLRPFVLIVAHRAGPQQIPDSAALLWLAAIGHTLFYIGGLLLLDAEVSRAVGVPLLDAFLQILFFGAILTGMGLRNRLTQTLTAVFGADFVLNLLAVPIALAGNAGPGGALSGLAILGLILWSLGVKGHILRHAVGFPYFVGVAIALGFFFVLLRLETSFFGAPV